MQGGFDRPAPKTHQMFPPLARRIRRAFFVSRSFPMSATDIFDNAPLGSIISFSDGQAKPPVRFVNKLREWESDNGSGMLIRKKPAVQLPTWVSPATFTLHVANYSSGRVVVLMVQHTHLVTSRLELSLLKRPAPGSILILPLWGARMELPHLAVNQGAAQTWLAKNRYSDAVFEKIPAESFAASPIFGRVA
jgi:hypothetical protein